MDRDLRNFVGAILGIVLGVIFVLVIFYTIPQLVVPATWLFVLATTLMEGRSRVGFKAVLLAVVFIQGLAFLMSGMTPTWDFTLAAQIIALVLAWASTGSDFLHPVG